MLLRRDKWVHGHEIYHNSLFSLFSPRYIVQQPTCCTFLQLLISCCLPPEQPCTSKTESPVPVPTVNMVTLPAWCTWHDGTSSLCSILTFLTFLTLPLQCFVLPCRQVSHAAFATPYLALQADSVKQLSQGVKASMAAFWTPERLHQLCRTLAYHFFTLTVIIAPATPPWHVSWFGFTC